MDMRTGRFSAADSTFLECHFYESGLKKRSFQLGAGRPEWAPPSDWVGFRNEFKLSKQDQIIEFVRFKYRGSTVGWISVYQFAIDSEYGDRENYSGIGLWFRDGLITSPSLLLKDLEKFCKPVHERRFDLIYQKTKEFLSGYVESYIDKLVELSGVTIGWPLAATGVTTSVIRILPREVKGVDAIVENDILEVQFLKPDTGGHSRLLLHLVGSGSDAELTTPDLDRALHTASGLAKLIPIALREAGLKGWRASNEASKLEAEIRRISKEKQSLMESSAQSKKRIAELEAQIGVLKEELEKSDEYKRFERLYNLIKELDSKIHVSFDSKFRLVKSSIDEINYVGNSIVNSLDRIKGLLEVSRKSSEYFWQKQWRYGWGRQVLWFLGFCSVFLFLLLFIFFDLKFDVS